jgi:hypothetical protein
VPLWAQWSGSIDVAGGLGGMEGSVVNDDAPMFHGLLKGAFRLNYETDKFSWTTRVYESWEPNTTDNARMQYKNEEVSIVYKAATTKPLTTGLRSDFLWTTSPDRNISFWVLYEYTNDRARNHTLNFNGDVEEMNKFSYYYELPVMDGQKLGTGFHTYRGFNSGRNILQSSFAFQTIHSDKVNTWTVFKVGEGVEGGTTYDIDDVQGHIWRYRITPNSTDFDFDGDIHLQNTLIDGEAQLKLTPGVRLSLRHALDHNSGATQNITPEEGDEEIWVDSVSLRENFNFLSFRGEPFLALDFRWKSLEAHADYGCEAYGRRLNDDTHYQPLKIKGFYPVGKANLKWNINARHSLNLTHLMSVTHPDYIKVCWYDRTAGYLDQLYRGNEQLLSPQTRRYALEYEFNTNHFVTQTAVSYTHVKDEIEQTWTNEEIGGREYKVFKWLNAADSRTVGISEKLGWQGEIITAHAGVSYNQSRRKAKIDGAIKDSYYWLLMGDISANLGKGWSMGADAHYRSNVATFFTLFKEYCELNVHVRKDFKRFSVFLEGRDLLDQERETTFISEETQEFWIEEVRGNRRIIILGVKWNF